MTRSTHDVAIIGAGPYGLAAAAHLRSAGLGVRVFGEPMEFWRSQMPGGMLLRSSWDASHISDPEHALTLDKYQEVMGITLPRPVPLENFVEYGQWFQRQVVPDLDQRKVARVESAPSGGFQLTLEDGEWFQAKRVLVATGLASFTNRPAQFDGLPHSLASHSSDHSDLGRFANQHVAVIGGGQMAIEAAAILGEAGAEVEVIMRAPQVRWLTRSGWLHNHLGPIRPLLYPPTDVGPPGLNLIVAAPALFKRFPQKLQDRIAYRCIRPAATGWLFNRMDGVTISTGCNVVSAVPSAQTTRAGVRMTLDDGTERYADHVLLATGYRVDVRRHAFLAPELAKSIMCTRGYPQLAPGFESSVPGLHFLGAPAAISFGPLMRFVSGTGYTAKALTRSLAGKKATGWLVAESKERVASG